MTPIPSSFPQSTNNPINATNAPATPVVNISKKTTLSWLTTEVKTAAAIQSRTAKLAADQIPLTQDVVRELNIPPSVLIETREGNHTKGRGSGFPIHPKLIVTARHCIETTSGVRTGTVTLPNGLWGDKKQQIRPIRYHLFSPTGAVITIELRDADGHPLKGHIIDSRLKGAMISKNFTFDENLPDIALIELEEPLNLPKNSIPPLLDDASIEHLLLEQSPKRLVGCPSSKIKADNNQDKKKYGPILKDRPMHISDRGVSKAFQPHGDSNNALYWEQAQGVLCYPGNSGGALIASKDGIPYYSGVMVAKHSTTSVLLPLKGKVMTDLILPTLNAINEAENKDAKVQLKTLEYIPNDPKASTLEWVKNILHQLLPEVAQDAIFTWRLEKAIADENFTALYKAFQAKGPVSAIDILSIKDSEDCTLYLKLISTWKTESLQTIYTHLTAAEKSTCMEMKDKKGQTTATYLSLKGA